MWSLVLAILSRLVRRQALASSKPAVDWELVPFSFLTGWTLPTPAETFDSGFPSIDESFVDKQLKDRDVTPREHIDGT